MNAENPHLVVDEQAHDEGLWFIAESATEQYLQTALRRLHAAVEGEEFTGIARYAKPSCPDHPEDAVTVAHGIDGNQWICLQCGRRLGATEQPSEVVDSQEIG